MRRQNFSIRAVTHIAQRNNRSPIERFEIVPDYLLTVSRKSCPFIWRIWNMDEVPCYIDMMSDKTITFMGEKSVQASGTGRAKTWFTSALTVSKSGKILKTMIILKGLKKAVKVLKNIELAASIGGSINDKIMHHWIDKV